MRFIVDLNVVMRRMTVFSSDGWGMNTKYQ